MLLFCSGYATILPRIMLYETDTADILLKSAVTFDTQVHNQMSSLVAALQPALIIFLAIAVGGITITMLSAVFSMNAVEF